MNPILPRYFFLPDAEARLMPNGRLYLYGSQDISGNNEYYCSKEYHVFSTDDPKLEVWKDHGVSLSNTKENAGITYAPDALLYAPDGIYHNGKYYLYACGADNFEAVLEADTPEGPFGNARPIVGADGDSIDPAVFIDDDGQAYLFWGQFRLRGAKLNADMATLDLNSLTEGILTEMEHGFHEGASIRKRTGKYYMVYTDISRGRATCLSYAMADAPLGPYKKCGVIVDNTFCDPESWNNHGSIGEYHNQWYIFYHRQTNGTHFSRQGCMEKIAFLPDGSIPQVEITSCCGNPLPGEGEYPAYIACHLTARDEEAYVFGVSGWMDAHFPKIMQDGRDGDEVNGYVCNLRDGSSAGFKYFDCRGVKAISIRTRCYANGHILVKTKWDGEALCRIPVAYTNIWTEATVPVSIPDGIQSLYFTFEGEGAVSLGSFTLHI